MNKVPTGPAEPLNSGPAPVAVSRQGMTPGGMARIFMVALLVLGPYLGQLFPFGPGDLATAKAASDEPTSGPGQSAPLQTTPAPSSETKAAPIKTRPTPGRPGIPDPNPNAGSFATCSFQEPSATLPHGQGIGGGFRVPAGAASNNNTQVRILDASSANPTYNQLATTQNDPLFKSTYRFDDTATVPTDKVFIIEFNPDAPDDLTTYYSYFQPNTPGASGRYSPEVATRVYVDSTTCEAHILVDPIAIAGSDPGITPHAPKALAGIPPGYKAVYINDGLPAGTIPARYFDAGIGTGRGIGGRVFVEGPNNTIAGPYYNSNILVRLYPFNPDPSNPVFTNSPVLTTTADAEGYYSLSGDSLNSISTSISATYAIQFGGVTGVRTSYYCNFIYDGTDFQPPKFKPGNMTAVIFNTSQPKGTFLTVAPNSAGNPQPSNPPEQLSSALPCKYKDASSSPFLAITTTTPVKALPGYHAVVRGNKKIAGKITLAPPSPANTPAEGAIAQAINVQTGIIEGASAPVAAADPSYTIENLRPGTTYYVKFTPADGLNLIGEYYNNKQLDSLGSADTVLTGVGVGDDTVAGIDAVLDVGWFLRGTVLFKQTGGGTTAGSGVTVQVFRKADLIPGGIPTPVDTTVTAVDGSYTTAKRLVPGQEYVLAFRPNGSTSQTSYIGAWCGGAAGSIQCTAVPTSDDATGVPIVGTTDRTQGIQRNINLDPGVVLSGNISADLPIAGLGSVNAAVSVYVYRVTLDANNKPTAPSLAQLINVGPEPANATYNFVTSALFTNTNYVLKFVPTTPDTDVGYRTAYLDDVLVGTTSLAQAKVVNSPVPGSVTGLDTQLLRAAAINVTLRTYRADLFPNNLFPDVRVEVYRHGLADGESVLLGANVTKQNGQTRINAIDTTSTGAATFTVHFIPLSGGFAAWDGTAQCGASAINIGDDPGFGPNKVLNLACSMPPFIQTGGMISNPGSPDDWTNSVVVVQDKNRTELFRCASTPANPTNTCPASIDLKGNSYRWQAQLASGKYFFAISPTNSLLPRYLPHWLVIDTEPVAVDASRALQVTTKPELPNNDLDIFLKPGGVIVPTVLQPDGIPAAGATVGFYRFTSGVCDLSDTGRVGNLQTTPSTGKVYSEPYAGAGNLCVVVTPTDPDFEGVTITNVPVTLNGQVIFNPLTITLIASAALSGVVKSRSTTGVESPLVTGTVSIEAVQLDGTSFIPSVVTTTLAGGFYKLKIPNAQFKLKFTLLAGGEVRYWTRNPRQTGTPSLGLAVTIQKQTGQRLSNYNMIFDQSAPAVCAITDQYVLSTDVSSAVIRYYTTCPGNTQVGYGLASVPTATAISQYTFQATNASQTFTHEITLTGLQAGSNYFVRPYSLMTPAQGGPVQVQGPVELTLRTATEGKDWYFATGDTSSSATLSTTEVLHLFNPNNTPKNVTINYYKPTGAPVARTFDLPANTRIDVPVHGATNPLSLASAGYFGPHSIYVKVNTAGGGGIMVEKSQTRSDVLNGSRYNGGYSVVGANAPGAEWWVPEISTNKATTNQVISVFNPGTIAACVQFNYYSVKGSNGLVPVVSPKPANQFDGKILPGGRLEFSLSDPISGAILGPNLTAPTDPTSFSLKVVALNSPAVGCNGLSASVPQPVVVEYQTRYVQPSVQAYAKGVTGQLGATGASQRWYFLDGQSDKAYDVKYALTNFYNVTTTVTLTVSIDNPKRGELALTKQVVLQVGPRQRYDYTVPYETFNQPAAGQRLGFTAQIDSDRSILAERSVKYLYSSSPSMEGYYQELGVTRSSQRWLFAAGDTVNDLSTSTFSDEALNVYNPNPADVTLSVTYYYTGAVGGTIASPTASAGPAPTSFTSVYVLPAYTRTALQPGSSLQSGYPSIGQGKVMAVEIKTGAGEGGILAERLVYYRKGGTNGGNATYGWTPAGS